MTPVRAAAPADTQGSPSAALPLGTRLAEFEVRSVLGVGGFGIVYLAWDHALEREVALKEYMPASFASRGEGVNVTLRSQADAETFTIGLRSFVNEARLLARFDHPALVKVHRFWEGNGTAYMVMPFYRGRTLRQVRQAMAPPDEAACRRLIDPLLSALELLHRENVFHRDIAPDNILIGDDGAPVLLDFGAARRVVSSTASVTAIIKPNFAPLEQYDVSGLRQGAWTDLYALGATVYYLLTGRAPTPSVSRTLCDELAPLAVRGSPGCSAGFLQAIDWTLALAPQNRPQDVASLRMALEGRPTPSGEPVAAFDATQPLPRTPAVVAAKPTATAARFASTRVWAALVVAIALLAAIGWTVKPKQPVRRVDARAPAAARVTAAPVAPAPQAEEPRRSPDPAPARRQPPVSRPAPPTEAPAVRVFDDPPRQAALPGPRERCGDRMFMTQLLCVKRECLRPANRAHPDCKRLEEMEQEAQARREQQEP